MKEYFPGMFTENEIRAIYDFLDYDKKRLVKITDIMDSFRRKLDEKCKRLLTLVFDRLDQNGRGMVAAHDVAAGYDPSRHPDVVAGKKTAEEEYRDFLDSFEVGGEVEGCVTRGEFMEYFSNVAAAMDDDDLFCNTISGTWLGSRNEDPNTPEKSHLAPDNTLRAHFKPPQDQGLLASSSKFIQKLGSRHHGSEVTRSKSMLTNDFIFGREQEFQPRKLPITNLHHHHHAAIFPTQQPNIPNYSPERTGKRQIRLKKSDVIVLDDE